MSSVDASGVFAQTFTGPDVCTATTTDSLSDGGYEVYWAGLTPAVSGLLTTTLANPSVSSYGAVGTTDAYDVYAAIIPDGSYAMFL